MRGHLGLALAGSLVLVAFAAPPVAFGTTGDHVDCRSGGDLQAAIGAAAPGATLVIRGTCVGTFVVDKDLTLQGRGHRPTLDAGGAGTVLTIPAANRSTGALVRIADLDITGGSPGGIENWGRLTLDRSTVSGSTGFGIYNNGDFGGTTVSLRRSVVRCNAGGGIWSWLGDLTLTHSSLSGNMGVGAIGIDSSFHLDHSTVSGNGGGGIVAGSQAVFALDHSTVRGNTGRGITVSNGSVVVTDSTVSDNTGGGIYEGVLGYLTVRHSRVIHNTADFGAGIYIANHDSGKEVTIEDTRIGGNTATTSGGGVYTEGNESGDAFARVVISHNTAGVSGGGLYQAGGSLTMTDVVFRHNSPDDCVGC